VADDELTYMFGFHRPSYKITSSEHIFVDPMIAANCKCCIYGMFCEGVRRAYNDTVYCFPMLICIMFDIRFQICNAF
jgi:hypothetical protein